MAQFSVNPMRFDPYKNFKFRVKWDGRYVAGISKVGALKRTTEMVEHREETVLAVAAERDLELLEAGARTLSLLELKEYIRARSDEGRDTARYREMLYSRLANPLAVLVFAFLAIPLGLAVEQRRSLAAAVKQDEARGQDDVDDGEIAADEMPCQIGAEIDVAAGSA